MGASAHDPKHATRQPHPDNHERFIAVDAAVRSASSLFARPELPAFDRRLALRVHEEKYLQQLDGLRGLEHHALDEDTAISAGSIHATESAASALHGAV